MLQKQRSHDERQSRARFYFVAAWRVFLSAHHGKPVGIARNRTVCISRRAYVLVLLKTRHLTRSRRQSELALKR